MLQACRRSWGLTIKQPKVVFGHRLSLAGVGGRNGAHQPIGSSETINVESSEKDGVTHKGLVRNVTWRGWESLRGRRNRKSQSLKDLRLPGPETLATAPRVLDVTGLGGGGSRIELKLRLCC